VPQGPTLDQFQEMMEKMVSQLGKAHQVQIAALEREMSKLTSLTEELKKQQAKLPAGAKLPAAKPAPAKPAGPDAAPGKAPAQGRPPAKSTKSAAPSATPTKPPQQVRESQAVSASESEQHQALVYERIAALHAERQTIWQKLMGMISSKPPGE
jgi:hypothetical protein